jgi:hypothetical protein
MNDYPEHLNRRQTDMGVGGKVLSIEQRLDKVERELEQNTAATNEVLEIVRMGKSFFRVLGVVGQVIKWAVAVGASALALWSAWKSQ